MERSDKLKYIRNIPVRQLPTIQTGVSIVWLENSHCSPLQDTDIRLGTFNNRCFVVCYSKVSKCVKFLKRARSRDYVIVVIVSYAIEALRRMLYRLQQHRIAQAILVVSPNVDAIDHLLLISDRIIGFQDQKAMLDHLEQLISEIEDQSLGGGLFTTSNRREKALKDLRLEFGEFIWANIFRVMVMNMPCDSIQAKPQMLAECRAYYRNDAAQLVRIDEFEYTYQASDAIRWYTKPGFLFYLVNKALRTGDILALYTFRYFISDLCSRLKEVSAVRSWTTIHVYRGAKLNRDELERLKVGALVAVNSFFSCSCNRRVAEMFIGVDQTTGKPANTSRDAWQLPVLFEIDVDTTKSPDVIVADISAQSELPDENEIIFSLGSTFIVNHITYDAQKSLWFIRMSSTSNVAQIDSEYESYINTRLREINSSILFGYALAQIGSDFTQSLIYFHRLLRILPVNHDDIPTVYYNLGRIYFFLEKYQKAFAYFRCAQLLLRRLLPQRIFDYCRVLGGLGTIYSELEDSKRALIRLEHAVLLQHKNLPDNHTEIPFHLHRLGHAYFRAKQFERALSVLDRSDSFFRTRMPVDHHGHGQTLHSMGLVYRALGNDEKALGCLKEALRKYESLLAKDHPYVASTCYQLSLIYKNSGEHELAVEYAKRSLYIRLSKLPYNHSEVKQSKELVDYLQRQQQNTAPYSFS